MTFFNNTSLGTFSISTSEIDLATQAGFSVSDKAEHLLIVQNVGSVALYVGNSGSAAYGYELAAGNELQIRVPAGDRLFGVTASSTATVRIVAVRG